MNTPNLVDARNRLAVCRKRLSALQSGMCHEIWTGNLELDRKDTISSFKPGPDVRHPGLLKIYEVTAMDSFAVGGRKTYHFCCKLLETRGDEWVFYSEIWWRTMDMINDLRRFGDFYFSPSRKIQQSGVPIWVEYVRSAYAEMQNDGHRLYDEHRKNNNKAAFGEKLSEQWIAPASLEWPYGAINSASGITRGNDITLEANEMDVSTTEFNHTARGSVKLPSWIPEDRAMMCYDALGIRTRNTMINIRDREELLMTQVTGIDGGKCALESYTVHRTQDGGKTHEIIHKSEPTDVNLPSYAHFKPSSALKRVTLAERCIHIIHDGMNDEDITEDADITFDVFRHSAHITMVSMCIKFGGSHEIVMSYTITTFQKMGHELEIDPRLNLHESKLDDDKKRYVNLASKIAPTALTPEKKTNRKDMRFDEYLEKFRESLGSDIFKQ